MCYDRYKIVDDEDKIDLKCRFRPKKKKKKCVRTHHDIAVENCAP
jgi:hypothetical protein